MSHRACARQHLDNSNGRGPSPTAPYVLILFACVLSYRLVHNNSNIIGSQHPAKRQAQLSTTSDSVRKQNKASITPPVLLHSGRCRASNPSRQKTGGSTSPRRISLFAARSHPPMSIVYVRYVLLRSCQSSLPERQYRNQHVKSTTQRQRNHLSSSTFGRSNSRRVILLVVQVYAYQR